MTNVVVNGTAYSDDGSAARDFQGGGAKLWLLPLASDIMVVVDGVDDALADAETAAASATSAAAGWTGTSTTSLAVGTLTKSFTMSTGKQFVNDTPIRIKRTSDGTVWMSGTLTSYNSATGATVAEIEVTNGSGTYTDWTITLSGVRGVAGGALAFTRTATAVTVNCAPSDDGSWLDCTSGTFDVTFSAAASLGSGWRRRVTNSGSGIITLNPNGAELVDGAATLAIHPHQTMDVQCDGSALRTRLVSGPKGQIHVRDVKASGTDAGGTTAATTVRRTLNTTVSNTIPGASLASDQVTLPAGAYMVMASAPAFNTKHQAWLYNETDAADLVLGTSATGTAGATQANTLSLIAGRFTLTAAKNVSIKQYPVSTVATNGLGQAASTGKGEVYTDLIITKES